MIQSGNRRRSSTAIGTSSAIDPEAISEVLLDHEIRSDRYGYADIATKRGRERWCAVGAEINWQTLDGDLGARRVPDAVAFERHLKECLTLEAELGRLESLSDRTVRAARQRKVIDSDVLLEVLAANDQRARVQARLAEARSLLVRLRSDETTWVALRDDEEHPAEDLDTIEARVLGLASTPRPSDAAAVRKWVTVTEFAEIACVSPATARRWVAGLNLPRDAGDPRRPWEPDAIPVDTSLGPRRHRLWIPGVSPGFLKNSLQRACLAEILATWPPGWSGELCDRPFRLDECVSRRLRGRGLEVPP